MVWLRHSWHPSNLFWEQSILSLIYSHKPSSLSRVWLTQTYQSTLNQTYIHKPSSLSWVWLTHTKRCHLWAAQPRRVQFWGCPRLGHPAVARSPTRSTSRPSPPRKGQTSPEPDSENERSVQRLGTCVLRSKISPKALLQSNFSSVWQ